MFGALYWREPLWLLLCLLPLLPWSIAYLRRRRLRSLIADRGLLPWVLAGPRAAGDRLARVAGIVAWLLLCIALAGPRTPRWIPPAVQDGEAVVAVLDLSASMAARDARPDRRRHASGLLAAWAATLPEALRLGIVVYAGHAHRLLPPSDDQALARHFVAQLDAIALPTLGNALDDALRVAEHALPGGARDAGRGHVLVLSDGDLDPAAKSRAEQVAAEMALAGRARLHVVGIGGAEAVAVPQGTSQTMVVDGTGVVSRRDSAWLQRLADLAQGRYRDAEALGGMSLAQVLELPPARIDPAAQDLVHWQEWFPAPLLAAVLVLLWSLRRGSRAPAGDASLLTLLVALCVGGCVPQWAGDRDRIQARQALAAGDHARARALFAALDGHAARFAEGVACYRLADHACAAQAFAQAAWDAPTDALRGRAVFNLGNAHFHLGDFSQAAVLFAEAEALGVAADKTTLNRSFAESLDAAVRRHAAAITETMRRADWRAQADGIPAALRDRLAEGLRFSRRFAAREGFATLAQEDLDAAVARAVERPSGAGRTPGGRHWVQSEGAAEPRSTAGLFNRLLPMEIGIVGRPEQPYRLEGHRPW